MSETSRRTPSRRAVRAGAACLLAASLLLGCGSDPGSSGSSGSPARSQGEREVVVGIPSLEEEVLDPTLVAGNGKQYAGQTTDWLIGLSPDGTLSKETGVLSDWQTEDGKTYVLTVRDGITWHDGRPLTADDVAFSFEMMQRTRAACLSCGIVKEGIKSFTAVDDSTVEVVLNEPSYNFIEALSPIDGDFKVVPRHYFEEHSAQEYSENGLGSGPWIFDSRRLGQFASFRANKDYWREEGIPKYDSLRLVFISDSATCLTRLKTGEVDMCALGFEQVEEAESSGFTVAGAKNVASHNIIFSLSADPTALSHETDFRRALSLAIDHEAIVERFYPDTIGAAQNNQTGLLFSSETEGYDPDLPPYEYNPDEARRLLESIGYDGTRINLWSYVLGPATELPAVNEVVAEMWNSVGVDVEVRPGNFDNYFSRLTADPINFDRDQLHAAIVTPRTRPGVLGNITTWMLSKEDGGVTGVYWQPEAIAERYRALSAIEDPEELDAELRTLNNDLREEYWAIPLNLRHQTWGLSQDIASWEPITGNPSELNLASLTPK